MIQNDDGDLSPYQNMLNTQIQEELNAQGLSGVPWSEISSKTFESAIMAAKEIVGEDPDDAAEETDH